MNSKATVQSTARDEQPLIAANDPAAILERWHKLIMDNIIAIGTCTDQLAKATETVMKLDDALRSKRIQALIDRMEDE